MSVMHRMISVGFIVQALLFSPILLAVSTQSVVEKRLSDLEESIDRIEAELDVMRSQSKMVISQTQLSFLNRFYVKSGLGIILPRSRTFSQKTDTGLGAFFGIGQYFGRHSVGDIAFEWDIYPSLSVRYRFELHPETPKFTFGPLLGYKIRIASVGPWDNFIDSAESLKDSYAFFGAIIGFPMANSLLSLEFTYLFNDQTFLVMNVGIHLFF